MYIFPSFLNPLLKETFLQYKRQKETEVINHMNNTNNNNNDINDSERRATDLLRALIFASTTVRNENSTTSNPSSSNTTNSSNRSRHTMIRENPFRRILLNDSQNQPSVFPSLFSDSDEDEDL